MTRNRGMLLRLKASFRWRILRRTRRETSYYAFVRALDSRAENATKSFCKEFERPARKDCCFEPYFERRTKRAFDKVDGGAEAALGPAAPFRKALRWSACSPPLFMICARETDHAVLSNKLKAGGRVQSLFHPANTQTLEKWRGILPFRTAQIEMLRRGVIKKLNQHSVVKLQIIASIA